jgi:hypothetical protein
MLAELAMYSVYFFKKVGPSTGKVSIAVRSITEWARPPQLNAASGVISITAKTTFKSFLIFTLILLDLQSVNHDDLLVLLLGGEFIGEAGRIEAVDQPDNGHKRSTAAASKVDSRSEKHVSSRHNTAGLARRGVLQFVSTAVRLTRLKRLNVSKPKNKRAISKITRH